MSGKSVLKAAQARHAPEARMLLRAEIPVVTPATLPGVWMSELELEALKGSCFEQGRQAGEQEGRRSAQQAAQREAQKDARVWLAQELKSREERHLKEQSERWRGLALHLAGQAQALREQLEAEVTEWTFAAVTRLLGERSPEDVAATVRKVLVQSGLDGKLRVLLHPQDLQSLQASGAADAAHWPEGITFAADPRVSLSGCLVESPIQTLDARLEVQLALVREALNDLRRKRADTVG